MLAPRLGPRRAARALALLARLFWRALPARRAVEANLRLAGLSNEWTPRVLANFGRYLGEFLGAAGNPESLRSVVGEGDWRALDEARAAGRGALLVTAHYGNWEVGAHAVRERYGAIHVIVRRTGDEALDDAIARARSGNILVESSESLRPVLAALRSGEIVAAAIDEPREDGEAATFLGGALRLPSGLLRAARDSGAAILPTCCRRQDGLIRMRIEREVASADEVSRAFEKWIREDPSQWMMMRSYDTGISDP